MWTKCRLRKASPLCRCRPPAEPHPAPRPPGRAALAPRLAGVPDDLHCLEWAAGREDPRHDPSGLSSWAVSRDAVANRRAFGVGNQPGGS